MPSLSPPEANLFLPSPYACNNPCDFSNRMSFGTNATAQSPKRTATLLYGHRKFDTVFHFRRK